MIIKTEYLYPNMELAEEISKDGKVILVKGTMLSKSDITKLMNNKIESVEIRIDDENETINDNFKQYIKEAIKSYDIEKLKYIASLFTDIYKDKNIIFDLTKYTTNKYDMYDHIVNTVIYATTVAHFYNLTNSDNKQIDLNILALSCMLSKYGYLCREESMFEKLKKHMTYWNTSTFPNIKAEDFYTYNEKCHTLYAYLLLQDYDLDVNVRDNILLSSEYYDNPSSPLGARLKDYGFASDVSALISVAETYDMLLIEGGLKHKEEPFIEVVDRINDYTSKGFLNPFWVKYILLDIPLYREGQKVLLSDNTIAVVESFDHLNALKPKLVDLDGNKVDYKEDLKVLRIATIDDIK